MPRACTFSLALLLSFCFLPSPTLAQEEKQTILDKNIPELKFEAIAIKDCLDFLKDVTGATFEVDWKAFKAQKVTEKSRVTLHVKNEKLSDVLTRMFIAAGVKSDPQLTAKDKAVSIKPGKKTATTKPA